ncbi:hypothetical protein DY023_16660 [Microbacterium bovistercoris]|uniref:DUF1023 domain-containing protein n=1 Tax=Microbacterium bovistercoris TaxID=2293570 RepID=A0A371NQN1_9MICO|nr:alpha/beta hydrolase [Microbacterium bovistercoris]REJ03945.1 hypothetical protein DY023_16660 [Microbacterium bovistercoris]
MTTSPKGYPFEHIEYDVGQMNSLHGNLEDAAEKVDVMQLVLRNVTHHLEGRGQALDTARSIAAEVADAFASPGAQIRRLKSIVIDYGTAAEEHGGSANRLMSAVTDAQTSLAAAESDLLDANTDLGAWVNSDEYASWQAGEETSRAAGTLRAQDTRYRDEVESATTTRDTAASDLSEAWTAWERSFESWDDAYARAVAALASIDRGYVSAADAATLAALADADSPEEVAAVWDALGDEEKALLASRFPSLIGNLEGIPYEYRIAANITALEAASKTSWGDPTDHEIAVLLDELRRGGVPVSLNLFDNNQGTAAMLYVDGFSYQEGTFTDPLSGVANVNVLLGGMLTELGGLGDWGTTARTMNEAVPGRSATIVWFGYDTPNYGTVGSLDQAVTGAQTLTSFLRGLDQVSPADAVTTVIGHSYGSTTAFLAVGSAPDSLGVDNLVAIGSAGLTDRALGDDPDSRVDYSGTNIYASTSPEDRWAEKGRWAPPLTNLFTWGTHPIDPGSLDGAVNFDSNGGYGPNLDGSEPTEQHHDGEPLVQTPGHGTHSEGDFPIGNTDYPGGYLQDGSESFANIVEIIKTGDPLTTPGGYGSDDWWLW